MVITSIAARRRCVILTAALAIPSLALAQQTQDESRESQGTLSEVVVTAQFKRENVQDTPIAITAVSAEMLEARSALNILDIANAAPNVTMRLGSTGFGKTNATYIRGVGQGDFLYAYSPRVSFYIDDVYHSTVFGSVFELLDVDRVEVLRGPQGTLFGRNAVGGAIRLFSKKPQGDNSGYIELTGGDFNRQGVKGVIDLPLIEEKLMARFSGGYRASDGWVDVYDWACVNPRLRGPAQSRHRQQQRALGLQDRNARGIEGAERPRATALAADVGHREQPHVRLHGRQLGCDDRRARRRAALHLRESHDGCRQRCAGAIPAASLGNGLALWFNNIGGPIYNIPVSPSAVVDGMGTPLNLPEPRADRVDVSERSFGELRDLRQPGTVPAGRRGGRSEHQRPRLLGHRQRARLGSHRAPAPEVDLGLSDLRRPVRLEPGLAPGPRAGGLSGNAPSPVQPGNPDFRPAVREQGRLGDRRLLHRHQGSEQRPRPVRGLCARRRRLRAGLPHRRSRDAGEQIGVPARRAITRPTR